MITPQLAYLPGYMLKKEDRIWHPDHHWFYACPGDGVMPHIFFEKKEVQVAVDPREALAWNISQRSMRLRLETPQETFTFDDLFNALDVYEDALEARGLEANTVHTYVDRSRRFLNWLSGIDTTE